jgi:phosphatidylserine synthase
VRVSTHPALYSSAQLRVAAVLDPLTVGVLLSFNASARQVPSRDDVGMALLLAVVEYALCLLFPISWGWVAARALIAGVFIWWLHMHHESTLELHEAQGGTSPSWGNVVLFWLCALLLRFVVAVVLMVVVVTAFLALGVGAVGTF